MPSIIAINNWVIGISTVVTVIGLVGGTATVKNLESRFYEIYESMSYIGAIVLILSLAVRGIIFVITGD